MFLFGVKQGGQEIREDNLNVFRVYFPEYFLKVFSAIKISLNKTTEEERKDLLSNSRPLVNFASLLLSLAFEVVMAIAMSLPVKLNVISLRLKICITNRIRTTQ